jgi:hypothetical protein
VALDLEVVGGLDGVTSRQARSSGISLAARPAAMTFRSVAARARGEGELIAAALTCLIDVVADVRSGNASSATTATDIKIRAERAIARFTLMQANPPPRQMCLELSRATSKNRTVPNHR